MTTQAPSLEAQKAAPSPVRPVSLPDELWTIILGNLEFHDLRRSEMVCKRFQTLLEGHQLASILFRAGPQEPIKKGQKLEIHPMLDLVDCVGTHSGNPDKATLYLRNTVDIEQVTGENVFELMNQDTGDNAYDYAAVDDFATRPACTKLHIQMASAKVGTLRCKTGITVRQIVRKTIPFWLREFDDCFEGHAWWNGWIGAIGQEDGSVLLKAGMFDS